MIQVKGTLKEMQKLYRELGLVDATTSRIKSHGNTRYIDPVATRTQSREIQYTFNPTTGLLRRRRIYTTYTYDNKYDDKVMYTTDYTTVLNSQKTVVTVIGEKSYKRRDYIPIHSLVEQMQRAVSPILAYREEKK